MDYRSAPTASRAGRTPYALDKHQHHHRSKQETANNNAPGLLHYDSDRSTTLDSLKDLMAFSQRTNRARHEDILFAAKHARAHMPAQFREPPSSTGSHGTITNSSIHMGGNDRDDLTNDSSSTFSAGPDAESTRASVHYQRDSHRVRKSTGRFGSNGDEKRTATDILSGVVNTSALFRTFKEWRPEDVTDTGIFEDADAGTQNENLDNGNDDAESTTNFGVIDNLVHFDKENRPAVSSATQNNNKQKNGYLSANDASPRRNNRPVLQATVQNESQTSIVMTSAPAAAQKPKPSPLRHGTVSRAAAPASVPSPALKKSVTTGSLRETGTKRRQASAVVFEHSPLLDELSSPETSAGSREDIDLGICTVATTTAATQAPPAPQRVSSAPPAAPISSRVTSLARADSNNDKSDGATNQSFIVPSKSFPLLHNLVTGTLRFTPGNYFYSKSVDAQQKYQLPAGPIPEDEKEIFVDIETIREEVKRLQEHDEMLQNEIIQGEIKYKSLLDRFYSLAHKASDHDLIADLDHPLREIHEDNQLLQNKILELETDLDVIHSQYEEQAQISTDLAAERDAAVKRAKAATEQAKKLAADFEALRERMAASAQRPNQEAQRRIQQLEQMVAERERVIKALKDERDAATSSHREEQRLHKERIARMDAEKRMLSGDHAKCNDEKYALTTAKDALAQKNTALKEKLHAVRQQCKDREATVHTVVDRQRTQITKLQVLLREKEKSVHQLDENFRKLRESWSSKDETLMRMTEVLGQWPGGLPQEHRGTVQLAETTPDMEEHEDLQKEHEFDVDADDFQSEADEQDRHDRHDLDDHSDGASDSGQSAVDHSMDENMTSAFIIPDLDFQTENVEPEDQENDEGEADGEVHDAELERELAQVHAAARNAAEKAKASQSKTSSKSSQQKSVSFKTTTSHNYNHHTTKSTASTTTCKHNRVNCVVCCQNEKTGLVLGGGENDKVTVAVSSRRHDILPDPAMDPGSALAYVMKLLDDERRHLWMQILAMRKNGETEEALNDKQRPRRVVREAEELWNAYVLKVEQLNRLDDVLAGQRAAGQDMTREEIDVTITRILEV